MDCDPMKELVEEIEAFRTDIKRDLRLDDAFLTDQAIIDAIGNWEIFSKIISRDSEKENNLKIFGDSMERISINDPESEAYALVEKLKRMHHQN
ncbi:hypothetical protein GPU96_05g09570 [Encephalitozoon hellem]|uniref:Uncharacterized protein n=2 Tax=Encephalitozoon hellem TaxID=27973 RepID=A0A9Q9C325_ENCHE|nr:hypothetical protein GPU96_05g09570 [Encephalitozoon hellem]